MSQDEFAPFRARFEALAEFISKAEACVKSGSLMEIGALDQEVVKLCQEVKDSSPEIAKQAQPYIADMISALDTLARELEAFKAAKEKEPDNGGD